VIHIFPPLAGAGEHRRGPALAPPASRAICKASAAVVVVEGHLSAVEAWALLGMERHELDIWTHVVRNPGLRRMFIKR
jgi:hypothetical protein